MNGFEYVVVVLLSQLNSRLIYVLKSPYYYYSFLKCISSKSVAMKSYLLLGILLLYYLCIDGLSAEIKEVSLIFHKQ